MIGDGPRRVTARHRLDWRRERGLLWLAAMAKRAFPVLVLLLGCNNGGVLGGGSGAGGAAGAGGTATCTGTAPFGCMSSCATDVGMTATCRGGEWVCLSGVRSDTCTCPGNAPPGYVCGSDGWVRGGGGVGGAEGGAGGAGGAGQGGLGGQGNESCSTAGTLCVYAPAWCCGGLTCQGGICLPPPDAGTDAATCSGTAGFYCLLGNCQNDVALEASCKDGAWACPAGTTDTRSCGRCIGLPVPGSVCGDGGWVPPDATSDGQ